MRNFVANIGVSKTNGTTQLSYLEHFVREDLNKHSLRVMAVLNPLKVVLTNYPDDLVEEMDAVNNPEDESAGNRKVPFSKVLYIEQDDFREDPPKQYFRLAPDGKSACATATSSPARKRLRIRPAMSSNCAVPMIPQPAAETLPTVVR